jgi:hypothetical protein
MPYGDVVVIDISRNLLLIMSNRQHIIQNNGVTCLSLSKYREHSMQGRIFIVFRFNHLRGILSKLFPVSILGTKFLTADSFYFQDNG